MNKMKTMFTVITAFCLCGLIGGCASSNLVDVWKDPTFQETPLSTMLVIAARKDATKRRIWEDAFSAELTKHGVRATSSYRLFTEQVPDTHEILAAVEENGFGGILVVLNWPAELNTHFVPGQTRVVQDSRVVSSLYPRERFVYHNNLESGPMVSSVSYWQRYRTYYREIEYPGYIDSQSVDIRTVDVTTTGKDGRLVWSATSRTPDPESVVDVQRGVVRVVLAQLANQSIIQPRR